MILQKCDILLHIGKSPISKLIASESAGNYSHASVYVSDYLDIIFESVMRGGVRARYIGEIKQDYDVYRVKGWQGGRTSVDYDQKKVLHYLAKHLNKKYDKGAIAYFGFLKVASFFSKNMKAKKNQWQKDEDFFCSEYVRLGFKHGGLDPVPQKKDASMTTPNDIARSPILEKVGEIRH